LRNRTTSTLYLPLTRVSSVDLATSFFGRALVFCKSLYYDVHDNLGGSKFFELNKGGEIMRYAALLLGIVFLLIFAACEKGEQPAKNEYQGSVEGVEQESHGVTQGMEGKAEEAVKDVEEETHETVESLKEKTGEAVETVKEKTGEAVETVKQKAAEPFQGMAEKMGGHSEAAKEAME
jgi:gas vesicle protein